MLQGCSFTVAPGRVAWLLSVTVPIIVPVLCCAQTRVSVSVLVTRANNRTDSAVLDICSNLRFSTCCSAGHGGEKKNREGAGGARGGPTDDRCLYGRRDGITLKHGEIRVG